MEYEIIRAIIISLFMFLFGITIYLQLFFTLKGITKEEIWEKHKRLIKFILGIVSFQGALIINMLIFNLR